MNGIEESTCISVVANALRVVRANCFNGLGIRVDVDGGCARLPLRRSHFGLAKHCGTCGKRAGLHACAIGASRTKPAVQIEAGIQPGNSSTISTRARAREAILRKI